MWASQKAREADVHEYDKLKTGVIMCSLGRER